MFAADFWKTEDLLIVRILGRPSEFSKLLKFDDDKILFLSSATFWESSDVCCLISKGSWTFSGILIFFWKLLVICAVSKSECCDSAKIFWSFSFSVLTKFNSLVSFSSDFLAESSSACRFTTVDLSSDTWISNLS